MLFKDLLARIDQIVRPEDKHMDNDHIHRIDDNDILTFRKYCAPGSHFFSDSEAFINSYVDRETALCYNDDVDIFFIGSLSKSLYFLCSPKGPHWQEKMLKAVSTLKKRFGKHVGMFWLWELPRPLGSESFQNKNLKVIKFNVQKRHLVRLSDFKNLSQFLYRNSRVRKQWNKFFSFL